MTCDGCAGKGQICGGQVMPKKAASGPKNIPVSTMDSILEAELDEMQQVHGYTKEQIVAILRNARQQHFAPTPSNILYNHGFSDFVYPQ
jgi:hypothetical protein